MRGNVKGRDPGWGGCQSQGVAPGGTSLRSLARWPRLGEEQSRHLGGALGGDRMLKHPTQSLSGFSQRLQMQCWRPLAKMQICRPLPSLRGSNWGATKDNLLA